MARLLKLPQVSDKSASRTTQIYKEVKGGLFPPPIKLTGRSSAWVEHEVDAVINARIAGQTNDQIRDLVTRLVAARTQTAHAA